MAHIRDVHNVLDVIAVVLQHTAQLILKEIGTKITDVRVVVDRRAAAIQTNPIALEGFERSSFSRVSVEQLQWYLVHRGNHLRTSQAGHSKRVLAIDQRLKERSQVSTGLAYKIGPV